MPALGFRLLAPAGTSVEHVTLVADDDKDSVSRTPSLGAVPASAIDAKDNCYPHAHPAGDLKTAPLRIFGSSAGADWAIPRPVEWWRQLATCSRNGSTSSSVRDLNDDSVDSMDNASMDLPAPVNIDQALKAAPVPDILSALLTPITADDSVPIMNSVAAVSDLSAAIKSMFPPKEQQSKTTPAADIANVTVDSSKQENSPDEHADIDALLLPQATTTQSKRTAVVTKTWAHMVDALKPIPDAEFAHSVPELARDFPFKLDWFQKYAVMYLERGECVFVAAHTSAGKTVVAEYAVALAQKHMTRAIYTSPIKALSNQKFRDFRLTFGDEEVGLLTGDVQIRPEAPCVIMTTEILRSMLYRGSDMIRDVEFVIFDEVHYINDLERGVVWEEVIIMLPPHVTIILLSATVPNTFEFADWVGRTKQKVIHVISTLKRPVPLEHHLFIGSIVPAKLFPIVDKDKQFSQEGYRQAWDAVYVPKEEKKVKAAVAKNKRQTEASQTGKQQQLSTSTKRSTAHIKQAVAFGSGNSNNNSSGNRHDRTTWSHLVNLLKKSQHLPTVLFAFSKRRCETFADNLNNMDLLTAREKSEVHVFCERSLARVKGSDKELPQILRMKEMLDRGIGVHHGGLLPIVKELVEILFARNLIKVLFATETFAMGVNMPARAVVFTDLRKHDGQSFRNLLPGEYTQMSGRAGRRGLDATGLVIIACGGSADMPEAATLQEIILGTPTKLASQFRLTYNMILNLLRVEALKIEEMMKRSFFEHETQRALPDYQAQVMAQESQVKARQLKRDQWHCHICDVDLDAFCERVEEINSLQSTIMHQVTVPAGVGGKLLASGRVLIVNCEGHRNAIAAIIRPALSSEQQQSARDKHFWCLVLGSRGDTVGAPPLPLSIFHAPDAASVEPVIVQVAANAQILFVLNRRIQLDPSVADINASTKNSNAWQSAVKDLMVIADEVRRLRQVGKPVPEVEWESKIRDFDLRQSVQLRSRLLATLDRQFQCTHCPTFAQHFAIAQEMYQLSETLAQLKFQVSDKNLSLLPDYHQRLSVLKLMGYIDDIGAVNLKGRVAVEINSGDSLLITELIMENRFTNLQPQEIVALLAAFVFQEKVGDAEKADELRQRLPSNLRMGVDFITETAVRVAEIQAAAGLPVSPEEYLESTVHFGLTEVVYEWACGTPFKQITELTEVLEGSIVRCITRLDELCREMRDAARVIGNADLYQKMDVASASIKRDIVFAGSLYV